MAKKRRGAGKGGNFERKMCKEISLWWTGGENSDVFWRTSNSGGRATTRKKASQRTFMQHGDVGVVDPIGKPLLDFVTIELKNGYPKTNIFQMLDAPNKRVRQQWAQWRHKAIRDMKANESKYWMIIHQRTCRAALVYLPKEMALQIGATPKTRAMFWFPLMGKTAVITLKDFWKLDPGKFK